MIRTRLPPGPRNPWWGFGHVPALQKQTWGYLRYLADQYGDVVTLRVGPVRVYQFRHPDHLRQILVEQGDCFRKPLLVRWAFRPWLGDGILMSSGKAWPRRRRIVESALQRVSPESQAEAAVRHTKRLFCNGASPSEPAPQIHPIIDGPEAFERLAFAVALETAVGRQSDEEIDRLFEAATILQDDGIYRASNVWQEPRWAPTARGRRLRSTLKSLREFLARQISLRQFGPSREGDFISGLLQTPKNGAAFSPAEIQDGVTSIVFGGKETAGGALFWTAFLLARHPEVQQRAAEEVGRVLQGRTPSLADVSQLGYLEMVLQEAMRLYPPVPVLSRRVVRPVSIGGYRIGRGSTVLAALYLAQRDPRFWEAPDEFRPERFARSDGSKQAKERSPATLCYLPFGAGVHVCIGKKLALLEGVLVFATLLSRYRIMVRPEDESPELHIDMRLRPRTPVRLELAPLFTHA